MRTKDVLGRFSARACASPNSTLLQESEGDTLVLLGCDGVKAIPATVTVNALRRSGEYLTLSKQRTK